MLARIIKQLFIFFLVFLVIVGPLLAITYHSYNQINQDLTNQIFAERQALARQSARIVESRLDAMSSVGRVAARDIADVVEENKWEEAVNEISYISDEFPFVDRIFLSDLEGHTTAYFPPSPENVNKDFSFRDWYKGVSKNWTPYASEVFKRAPHPQYNTVAMMSPIKDENGKPLGAVGLAINLNSFYELSNNFKVDKGGFLYIVNQKGQIVAHPTYPSQGPMIDYTSVPVVQKLLAGESGVGINFNPVENEERLAAYEVVPNYNWGVVVTDPVSTAFSGRDATLNEIKSLYIFIISLSVILASLLLIALQKLQASRRTLMIQNAQDEAILSGIGDAVFAINANKEIILFNNAAEKISGYTEKEAIGKPYSEVLKFALEKDGTPTTEFIDNALKGTAGEMNSQTLIIRKDGSTLPVADSAAPIWTTNKEIQGVVVVFRDVTKEHQLAKLKDEFVSLASHELRTPMTAIKGFISMILDGDFGTVPQKLQEPIAVIGESANRLIHLVNDMLNVSRIEAGRLKFNLVNVTPGNLVTEVVNSLQPIAKEKNLTLTTEISISEDISIQADIDKFKQVLHNLIGNSLKFTDKGGITVKVIVQKEMVEFQVIDTGVGIAPADQEKLFNKFQQVSSSQAGKPAGTGLGLYLSKELVQRQGGEMWISNSEVGKGSTFSFTLPLTGSPSAIKVKYSIESEAKIHPDQKND